MIDLCTVTNDKYLANAILLAQSYINNSYHGNIYLYYFDVKQNIIVNYKTQYDHINFLPIPKFCDHAYEPLVFAYKTYAIKDCLKYSDCFLYSDATNLFQKLISVIDYFMDDSLFLQYTHPILANTYWTTKKCFKKMQSFSSINAPQYWAGLQGYKNTKTNQDFINLMYEYMLDPDIALPNTSIQYPDGNNFDCIQHRCDQSVFSVLIDKTNKHQNYDPKKQALFGDQQTFKLMDKNYSYNETDCCILSRKTKYLSL